MIFLKKKRACLHECEGPQVGEVTCGGLPHLSRKRDHLKIERLYLSGLPHPPGIPPPCKQAQK